jgi:transcriptional regulator with XRE-family HTH domain
MPRIPSNDQISPEQAQLFARWLQGQRSMLKYTQEEMAQKLGMSKSYYNTIENARRIPSGRLIVNIAQTLGERSILRELFGEEVVQRLVQERDFHSLEEESHDPVGIHRMKQAATEIPFVRESTSYLGEDCTELDVKLVPVASALAWYGLDESQVAIIRPLESMEDIQHGSLLYARGDDPERSFYAFANLTEPSKPRACPVELDIRVQYDLTWEEMEKWGLDSRKAVEEVPLSITHLQYDWNYVVGILSKPIKQGMAGNIPYLHQLSRESRKQLIEFCFHLYELEKKLKATNHAEVLTGM